MYAKRTNSGRGLQLQSGQAAILLVVFVLLVAFVLAGRATGPVQSDAKLARELQGSKNAAALADAGTEDISYRIKRALKYDPIEYVSLGGLFATTTITTSPSGNQKMVVGLGSYRDNIRQKSAGLIKGDQVDFNYAVQVGQGGFSMANSSSVTGNIYSNGPVTGSGNIIRGSVISAGPTGLIDGIHATGTARAHTIKDSTVDKDAYYQVKTNTSVGGTSYPGSPDLATATFPISDAQITEWEADATAGGVHTSPCPYTITTSVTLGPKKIDCDLTISQGAQLTLSGPLWVNGKFTISNSSGIKMSPALESSSVVVIADQPSDRLNSGTITISNSTTFTNSGTKGSFIFLISGNTSEEEGGEVIAIDLNNSAQGAVVLYSNHGSVSIGNSSQLRSVTGFLISMKNSAQLIYEDGLESALFDTGPGGSWNVQSWKETQ